MSDVNLNQFKEIFVSEAKEHISALNTCLLELEKTPENPDIINEIFRGAHTLKGMAATMGFNKVTELTHTMENVLDKFRSKEFKATPEAIEVLFDCFDTLELLLDEIITEKDKGVDVKNILEKLASLNFTPAGAAQEEAPEQGPDNRPQTPETPERKSATQSQATETPQQIPTVSTAKKPVEKNRSSDAVSQEVQSVRIKVEHLDKLMNVVGELVIAKARLAQIAENTQVPDLSSVLNEISQFTIELQEEVLKTRMVPVKSIFDRYPRMVRDLSHNLGKEIEFVMTGTDIEIDRMLLHQINEPLVHLLRNAVDHGIECPEIRKAVGKPETGKIELASKREKGSVWIEVSDDGKGIDVEEIKRKALEKGVIKPEEAQQMTDGEAKMLICLPGFSTVEKITDVSGRGVGMDVVKNLVEAFSGKLDIKSKKGLGSNFIIQLPLTLAIIQAIIVKVGDETYAIPLANISEIVGVYKEQVRTIKKKEVLLLRDQVIPLVNLGKIFNLKSYNPNDGRHSYAVIVDVNNEKLGLVIDDLAGKQEIVIKTLSGVIKNSKNFSGATILGDGRVIMIIDVASIYGAQ